MRQWRGAHAGSTLAAMLWVMGAFSSGAAARCPTGEISLALAEKLAAAECRKKSVAVLKQLQDWSTSDAMKLPIQLRWGAIVEKWCKAGDCQEDVEGGKTALAAAIRTLGEQVRTAGEEDEVPRERLRYASAMLADLKAWRPAPAPTAADRKKPVARDSGKSRVWAWTMVGVATAGAAVAGLSCVKASNADDSARGLANQNPGCDTQCRRRVGELVDERDTWEIITWASAGVTLVGAGLAAWCFSEPDSQAAVMPVFAPGEAGVMASWAF